MEQLPEYEEDEYQPEVPIPHDPPLTPEQVVIRGLVDSMYERLKW